ncbi:MAG TPA: hypothetical protein VN033_15400 [Vulgatibacter sp.]|nr:hypothetical protein [Vulgatibacter sp.]
MSPFAKLSPIRLTHAFVVANIAFIGGDIVIAHASNSFAEPMEWAPILFSAVATPLLVPGALGARRPIFATIDVAIAWLAILVGAVGMVFHLESRFFEVRTLHSLVYSAPFVAPISYVGVGLLLLLVRSEEANTPRFGPWVLVFALGGFAGNFVLAVLDHAQGGFFRVIEWLPVWSAAFAIGFLLAALAWPGRGTYRACGGVMVIQALVGLLGFGLHLAANLAPRMVETPMVDRFVYGAPAFAPLLFVNLAFLAGLGLWAGSEARSPAAGAAPA